MAKRVRPGDYEVPDELQAPSRMEYDRIIALLEEIVLLLTTQKQSQVEQQSPHLGAIGVWKGRYPLPE